MVTSIHNLFDRATADRHMYDWGGVISFESHFAIILAIDTKSVH